MVDAIYFELCTLSKGYYLSSRYIGCNYNYIAMSKHFMQIHNVYIAFLNSASVLNYNFLLLNIPPDI